MDFLTATEKLRDGLSSFELEDICSEKFYRIIQVANRLTRYATIQAIQNDTETVVWSAMELGVLPLLVRFVLVVELWRVNVFPRGIESHFSENPSIGPLYTYFTHFSEALILSLLETSLFHEVAVASIGESAIDLLLYSIRNSQNFIEKVYDKPPNRFFDRSVCEITQIIGLRCLMLIRMLVVNRKSGVQCLQYRLRCDPNYIFVLISAIRCSPWKKETSQGTLVFDGSSWNIGASDGTICKTEANIWMTLYHVLSSEDCPEINSGMRSLLLGLRQWITRNLVDQLLFLGHLMKLLEHLAINVRGSSMSREIKHPSILLSRNQERKIQPLGGIWESLERKYSDIYDDVAKTQIKRYLAGDRLLSENVQMELLADLTGIENDHTDNC